MDNNTKITMLTIKEAAALVEGLTEYRVRQMCINNQIPHIMAGKKYLINRDKFFELSPWRNCVRNFVD